MVQGNNNFLDSSQDALEHLTLSERGFSLIRKIATYTISNIKERVEESVDMLNEGITTDANGDQSSLVDFWQKSCKIAEASSCILGRRFIGERPSAGDMWLKVNSDTPLGPKDIATISRNLTEIKQSINSNHGALECDGINLNEKDFNTLLDAIPLFESPAVSFHSSNLLSLFTDIKSAENNRELSKISKSDEYLYGNILSIENKHFEYVEKHFSEFGFASKEDLSEITSQIKQSNRDYNISPIKPRNRALYDEDEIKTLSTKEIIQKATDRAVVFNTNTGLGKKEFRHLDTNPYFVQIIGETIDATNKDIKESIIPRMEKNFNKEEDILEQNRLLTDVGDQAYTLSTKYRNYKTIGTDLIKTTANKPITNIPTAELLKMLKHRSN